MKKLFIFLMLFFIIFSYCNTYAQEFETVEVVPYQEDIGNRTGLLLEAVPIEETNTENKLFFNVQNFQNSLNDNVYDYIVEQCRSHADKISIDKYNLTLPQLKQIYYKAVFNNPDLMMRTQFSYTYTSAGYITSIMPAYIFDTIEETSEAAASINSVIDEYVQLADKFDNPIQKILSVHDEMIKRCSYDYAAASAPDSNRNSFHAYGFFINNTAVCQGYAQAFYAIAQKLGIEAGYCKSDAANHIWNYVIIDNTAYHIDVTQDDPDNAYQTAYHRYFLVCDETIQNNGSHSSKDEWATYFDSLPDCSSEKYESNFIFNIGIPCAIEYTDSGYVVSYHSSNYDLTFNSKTLHTPGLLVSNIITDESSDMFIIVLADKNPINTRIFSTTYNNGRLSWIAQSDRSISDKNTLYGYRFINQTNSETKFFLWNAETQMPYSVPVSTN